MGRMAMRTDGTKTGSSSSAGSRWPDRIMAVNSISRPAVESSALSLLLNKMVTFSFLSGFSIVSKWEILLPVEVEEL